MSSSENIDAYAAAEIQLEAYNSFVDIPKSIGLFEGVNNNDEQWVKMIYVIECSNTTVTIMDSVVLGSRTCRAISCTACDFIIEDVDVRHFQCYGLKECKVIVIDSIPVVENTKIFFDSECESNTVQLGKLWKRSWEFSANKIKFDIMRGLSIPNIQPGDQVKCYFDEMQYLFMKKYILLKLNVIIDLADLILELKQHWREYVLQKLRELEETPFTMSAEELVEAYKKEREEIEEPLQSVRDKVKEIVKILKESKYTVCYTGAGISTAANIPDYRGPSGIWTLLSQGKDAKEFDKDDILPTYTHYAITELTRKRLISYVISTNGDGLHMRSGLPRHLICEQHGNAHKEVCEKCNMEYYRQFRPLDKSDAFLHHTGRMCDFCGGHLRDTCVGFSEPISDTVMQESLFHARKSEVSIVLGASMNVQPAASFPDKCFKNNGKLVIVNLQKTPYDSVAAVRVFAKTDNFMKILMEELGIPNFDTTTDAVLKWNPPKDKSLSVPKVVIQQRKLILWQWMLFPFFVAVSFIIPKRK